jgi:hypothetical protein
VKAFEERGTVPPFVGDGNSVSIVSSPLLLYRNTWIFFPALMKFLHLFLCLHYGSRALTSVESADLVKSRIA